MNKILFFLMFSCFGFSYSQKLNVYSLQEVEELQQIENRLVLVFLTSSWCVYCKKMNQTVFKNKEVIELLNSKYYFVPIEADSKTSIFFKNREFVFKPKGIQLGYNEIIDVFFKNEQVAFPSILVFDFGWNRLLLKQSAMNKNDFLQTFK